MMFDLGVRYMTLTHNDRLSWVDLSHVSTDVMRQAIDVSTRPVMFSHSSARALCDNERNVPDDEAS